MRPTAICLPLVLLAGTTATQSPNSCAAPERFDFASLVVPVHRESGDAKGPAWTAGPGFKARFDDRITFYPSVPADIGRHLPIAWRTESVVCGDRDLIRREAASPRIERNRYELHRGSVTERYDVRKEGIEQVFVIAKRPAVAGDIVVTGRITTELVAAPVEARVGALAFHDGRGRLIAEYGAAMAFDAAGRRTDVTTSFDGERIRLRVAGSWLAHAQYPVTIDPLFATKLIQAHANQHSVPEDMEIARESESTAKNTIVMIKRQFSTTSDHDLYVFMCDSDMGNGQLLHALNGTDNITSMAAAPVCGVDRWLIAWTRALNGTSALFYVTRSFGDSRTAEIPVTLPLPRGARVNRVDVGGTEPFSTGTNGLLVYRVRTIENGSPVFRLWGTTVDPRVTGGPGTPSLIVQDSVLDFAVNQYSSGGAESWRVVWATLPSFAIQATQVAPNGSVSWIVTPALTGNDQPRDLKIAGRKGRYMIAFDRVAKGELRMATLDWPDSALIPTVLHEKSMTVIAGLSRFLCGVAFDANTRSHWTVMVRPVNLTSRQVVVIRVSSVLAAIDSVVVASGAVNQNAPVWGAITDLHANMVCHPIAYGQEGPSHPVYGNVYCYPPKVNNTPYGVGCTATILANQIPLPGSENFAIQLRGARPSAPAFLQVGWARASIDLTPLGAAGCFLNVANRYLSVPVTTTVRGEASHTLPIPSTQRASFYSQWIIADPSNRAGISTTRGLASRVR